MIKSAFKTIRSLMIIILGVMDIFQAFYFSLNVI
jgi:hypothetical protein